jgi:hypothetical protein
VTNGATANPPACLVELTLLLAAAS